MENLSFRQFIEAVGSVTMEDIEQFLVSSNPEVLMDWLQDSGDPDFAEIAYYHGIVADDDPYARGDLFNQYKKGDLSYSYGKITSDRDTNLIHSIGSKISKKINRMFDRAGEPFGGDMEYGDDRHPDSGLSISIWGQKGKRHYTFKYPNIMIDDGESEWPVTMYWKNFLKQYPEQNRLLAYMFVAEKFFEEARTHSFGHTGDRGQREIMNSLSMLIGRTPRNSGLPGSIPAFQDWLQQIERDFTQAKRMKVDQQRLSKLAEFFAQQQAYSGQLQWTDQMVMQFGQVVERISDIVRSSPR